jgi:hypothetical protein
MLEAEWKIFKRTQTLHMHVNFTTWLAPSQIVYPTYGQPNLHTAHSLDRHTTIIRSIVHRNRQQGRLTPLPYTYKQLLWEEVLCSTTLLQYCS